MWQFIAGIAIALIASFVLRPKPTVQPPAGLEDIKAPTADDGRELPVVFGCRPVRGPNVVWYGDLRTTPIKSKGGKK
jgi:hypothetical protein